MSPSGTPAPQRTTAVARTSPPFTWKQRGAFFLCLALLIFGSFEAWLFIRVNLQISKLKSPDAAVRKQAAVELGGFKNPRAVQPLLDALNDSDDDVQANAAKALGQIADPNSLQPLLADLDAARDNYRGNYTLKYPLAEAAGGLGPIALEPLMARLRDKDIGEAAGGGLVKIGAPAVDPLLATLNDPDPALRVRVAGLLGSIKDPRAVPALIAALKDKDLDVCKSAAAALGLIRDPRGDPPLIAILAVPFVADPDMDPNLIAGEQNLRAAAAASLGEINDPQAVSYLLAALHGHNDDVIAEAYEFYLRRGDPGTEDALIEALDKAGDRSMAEEFINSGNQKLHDAGADWAVTNNFEIDYEPGSSGAAWGGK